MEARCARVRLVPPHSPFLGSFPSYPRRVVWLAQKPSLKNIWDSSGRRPPLQALSQVWTEPAFEFAERHSLAALIVEELIAIDPSHAEVSGLGMREIQPA